MTSAAGWVGLPPTSTGPPFDVSKLDETSVTCKDKSYNEVIHCHSNQRHAEMYLTIPIQLIVITCFDNKEMERLKMQPYSSHTVPKR